MCDESEINHSSSKLMNLAGLGFDSPEIEEVKGEPKVSHLDMYIGSFESPNRKRKAKNGSTSAKR